ncbi:MAG TPA: S9 family peptidase [Allosphingosinicella sp.]|jgi:dipeptidyl aminopeptidase/acylaminoacyl peptidase
MRRSIVAAAAAFLAGGAAPAAPPPAIPAEAFGALASFASPRISPDGQRVLATADVDGRKAIIVYRLDSADGRYTRINLGELEATGARWAGTGRILLTVFGKTLHQGVEVPMSRHFAYDLDTGKMRALGGARIGGLWGGELIHVDPQGAFALIAAQPTVWSAPAVLRVDLASGDSKEIVAPESGVWDWYADSSGAVRAGLGVRGDRWFLLYRDKESGRFRRTEAKRALAQSVTELDHLLPVAGSDKGYAVANKATGRYGVYSYDFATDTVGEPVFEHGEVDVEAVAYSPRTGEPDSILYADDRDRIFWIDPEMRAVQARIDKALPDAVNRIVSRDAADKRMIVWSTGAANPGTYYLYDRTTRAMSELARPYGALEGKTLAAVEAVRYPARDGLVIPAYLTKPPGRSEQALPLIVMPHGGPFARDKWAYDAWAQFLANRGYVVLQPNFRGSTGYGKAFVEAASGQYGRKMQDDLDDGVRWLAGRGLVDPKRVCIMGASYGGYAAMWAAARNPDIYRCAISFAGISEVRTMLRYDPSTGIARRYYKDWRDRIRGEEGFDLGAVSPLNRAAAIRVPLLIAHGDEDHVVPVAQSRNMHEAMRRAKIEHEFVVYPGEGHGFDKAANSIDFLKRVESFLARHNPS